MTKKEIVRKISEELGLTQLQTKQIVQMTFDAIIDALVTEGRIELRNFGVFEVKKRAARKARNPRTEKPVDVPEKFVVTFKPGKEMEEQVRSLDEMPTGSSSLAADTPAPMSPPPRSPFINRADDEPAPPPQQTPPPPQTSPFQPIYTPPNN